MTKKRVLFLTGLLTVSIFRIPLKAQHIDLRFKRPPEVSIADFTVKFPGKSAIYLINDGHTDLYLDRALGYWKASTTYFYRIKILEKAGLGLANFKIPLRVRGKLATKQERLKDFKATTYNYNEIGYIEIEELSESDINRHKVTQGIEEVSFALPKVKVNSIIEVSYTIDSPFLSEIDDWYFQKDVPVQRSQYSVSIAQNFQYAYILSGVLKPKEYPRTNFNYTEKVWLIRGIPAFREEPMMTSREDHIAKLSLQLNAVTLGDDERTFLKSWEDVGHDLRENKLFEQFYSSEISMDQKSSTEELALARELYEDFKLRYSWNGKFGIYPDVSLREMNKKSQGNSSAMGLLLYRRMREAGLFVEPVLSSPRSRGKLLKNYPLAERLIVTTVRLEIANDLYLLDPINDVPFGFLGESLLNGEGMILSNFADWQDLNVRNNDIRTSQVHIQILEKSIRADVELNLKDYGVVDDDMDLKELFKTDWEASEILLEENETTSQKITARISKEVDNDLIIVPLAFDNIVFLETPFEAKERTYPIDFFFKKRYGYVLSIELAGDYEFESIPEGRIVKTLDNNLSAILNVNQIGDKLNLTFLFESKTTTFRPGQYHQVKQAYSFMAELANSSIIVKRKS